MESLVLSPQDVENLEAMSDGSTGYFYKMLDYLEKRVEDGVRRGALLRGGGKGRPGDGPLVLLRLQQPGRI